MPVAKITSKGQITIPVEVRKRLRLKAGDQVNFFEGSNGEYTFSPKTGSIMEMRGILKRPGAARNGPPVTIEEMDEGVLDAVAADYRRSVGEAKTTKEKVKAS